MGGGGFNVNMIIDRMMERYDTNEDGQIDADEQKEFDERASRMTAADKDGDGVISRDEVKSYMEQMMQRFGGGQGGGQGGPPRN
jgi:Ca2+-binding EF-hand superfamily protein